MTVGMIVGLFLFFSVCFILMIAGTANEMPFMGLVGLAFVLLTLEWVFRIPVWDTIRQDPWSILVYLVGYVGVGVLWSFPKWWFYVRKVRDAYLADMLKYKVGNGLDPAQKLTPDQARDFTGRYTYRPENRTWSQVLPIQVSQNKTKVLTWMVYWPTSMVWTIIDQPIKRAFLFMFEQVKGVYQAIGDRAFDGVEIYKRG